MNQESTPLPTAQEVLVSRRTLTVFCESLEDEAYAMTQPDRAAKLDDHARGFYRGQRDAAKRIRRAMFDGEVATTESASALVDRLIDSVAEDAFGGREDQSPETKAARATLIALVASQGASGGDRRVLQEALADLDATSWECQRCGHSEDCGTMDVAHAIRDHLAATPSEEPAQGEAVAWQVRFVMSDVGYWSGWAQCQSEADAQRMVARYTELGQKAEYRNLYASRTAAAASKEGK